jgi:hypothetical protein
MPGIVELMTRVDHIVSRAPNGSLLNNLTVDTTDQQPILPPDFEKIISGLSAINVIGSYTGISRAISEGSKRRLEEMLWTNLTLFLEKKPGPEMS